MAQVRLWVNPRDDEIYDLPRVCMACGARATNVRKTRFAWYPPVLLLLILVGVLPFLIVVVILTKRQRVELPFCDEHKNYFLLGRILRAAGWLGFLGAPVLFFGGIYADPKGGGLPAFLCLGWIGLLVLYLIAVRVFALLTKIRPTEITDRQITLTNVSSEFARALAEDEVSDQDDAGEPTEEKPRRDRRANDDRYQRGDKPPPPRRSTEDTEND